MLMLVAFALQSFVTQTHIHIDGHAVTAGFATADESPASAMTGAVAHKDHGKYPPADDSQTCPICQEMLYAGHYVMPAAVPLVLPVLPVSIVRIVTVEAIQLAALSHNWQGRAPPRL